MNRPKTYWRSAITVPSSADSSAIRVRCAARMREVPVVREISRARAYYELVSAPLWTQQGADSSALVVEPLTEVARELELLLTMPSRQLVAHPLIKRLEFDAWMTMGLGEPAAHAYRLLRH